MSSRDHNQQLFVRVFNVGTILLFGWFFMEFFTRGQVRVANLTADLYIVVLGFYAGDKEIHRWRHRHRSVKRRGEMFVFGWVATLVFMLLVEVLGGAEHGYRVPVKLGLIAGSVVVIYFITEYLKTEFRQKSN